MNTKKYLIFATLLFSLIVVLSCGKVNRGSIENLNDTYPIRIHVSINVQKHTDPSISIRARDLTIDRERMILIIKDGLLSGEYASFHGIKFSGEISFPLNGSKIEIWKDGRYEYLEDHRDTPVSLPSTK